MDITALSNHAELYWSAFFFALVLFSLAELLKPGRATRHGFLPRWSSNFGLAGCNLLMARFVLPIGSIGLALLAEHHGWGVMNAFEMPFWVALLAAIMALDLAKYVDHRLHHSIPLLWRLHRVHHADLDVDFTTGFRHHPLELVTSSVIYGIAVVAIGAPIEAVMIYQILSMLVGIYTHANIRYPARLDRLLRLVLVTRDVHIVHHSAVRSETDSNYGQLLVWWDRLFGSYVAAPSKGLNDFVIGLEYWRGSRDLYLDRVLAMPFRERRNDDPVRGSFVPRPTNLTIVPQQDPHTHRRRQPA